MSNKSGPGPIPNRWLNCPRNSQGLIIKRFLAFKTPLSDAFQSQMPLECTFTPEMLFGYVQSCKYKLGLWIDLTNTKRFYDREVVQARGAQYVKLKCRGYGETPSPEQTQSFIELVNEYSSERPLDIIGVHCTHGYNRTGFLIVSYLVERLDCSVSAALSIFASARPPGIYKQHYINELFRRYDTEEVAIRAPELPEWCLEYDDSDGTSGASGTKKRVFDDTNKTNQLSNEGGESLEDANDDNQTANNDNAASVSNGTQPKKRRREMIVKNATFMADVSGIVLVTDQPRLGELQLKVQEMCGWKKNGFPGSQPVSMDKDNLEKLQKKPYRVSWKADGTRYMMLIKTRNEVFFFDRNLSCFQIENLSFVSSTDLNKHLEDTLLDGEMVLDKLKDQIVPRYLVYDIIKLSGENIGEQPFFPNRIDCIKKEIVEPRHQAITKGIVNRSEEPLSVRNKDFWDITQTASLLGEKFAKTLLHEPDGLIFQPSLMPYTPGPCADVLKWKPLNMNSVDFRLKISTESGVGIVPCKIGLLYVGGHDVPFCNIKYTKELKELDNKIIECSVNSQRKWEFMRERTDKSLPNSYNTARAVVESIRVPITKEILLAFIAANGYRDDNLKMPPPKSDSHHRAIPQQSKPQQYH